MREQVLTICCNCGELNKTYSRLVEHSFHKGYNADVYFSHFPVCSDQCYNTLKGKLSKIIDAHPFCNCVGLNYQVLVTDFVPVTDSNIQIDYVSIKYCKGNEYCYDLTNLVADAIRAAKLYIHVTVYNYNTSYIVDIVETMKNDKIKSDGFKINVLEERMCNMEKSLLEVKKMLTDFMDMFRLAFQT